MTLYHGLPFQQMDKGVLFYEGKDFNILLTFGEWTGYEYGWCATMHNQDGSVIREYKHRDANTAVRRVVKGIKQKDHILQGLV